MGKTFDIRIGLKTPTAETESALKETLAKNLNRLINEGGPAIKEILSFCELTVTQTDEKECGEIHFAKYEAGWPRKAVLEDGRKFVILRPDNCGLEDPKFMYTFSDYDAGVFKSASSMLVVEIYENGTCSLVEKNDLKLTRK